MAVGKPILGVLEKGTEVRNLIEECSCGKCCEPGMYDEIEKLIRWFIKNDSAEMGYRGRKYIENNLSKSISIEKYINVIKGLEIE